MTKVPTFERESLTNEEIIERLNAGWSLSVGCFTGWVLRSKEDSHKSKWILVGFQQVSEMHKLGLIAYHNFAPGMSWAYPVNTTLKWPPA